MKKIILIPAIILLVCCITVGAFNVVTRQNNRPMTFYESLITISEIEFSLDDMAYILNKISELWTEEASSYAGVGGSPGNTGGGGTFPGADNSFSLLDIPSGMFGSIEYEADTGFEWLNPILNTISKIIATIILVFNLLVLIVQDAVTTVSTLFEIILKFIIGVPKNPIL